MVCYNFSRARAKLIVSTDDKVIFCTGGSGDICSAQVKALVYLGANAYVVGRNEEKALRIAREIADVRIGSKVVVGKGDVRDAKALEALAADCFHQLGGIDFVMYGRHTARRPFYRAC